MVVQDVTVSIQDNQIVAISRLEFFSGAVHVLMGPNGSGKSTFAYALMGHPRYTVTGTIMLDGANIIELSPDKRARQGLFLSLQQPIEIPGLTVFELLRESYGALHGAMPLPEFQRMVYEAMDLLGMDHAHLYRHVHVGFSGGEKKRLELLQLLVLKPKVAILDEIDSGLDVDALKIVGTALRAARLANPDMIIILITHYQRILRYVEPDYVHVMARGSLVRTGGLELAVEIENRGYDAISI